MQKAWQELIRVLTEIREPEEIEIFLNEILTDKEISDISLRWQLMKELHAGETQRSIAARHRISLCKITRGSKILKQERSVTREILERYHPQE